MWHSAGSSQSKHRDLNTEGYCGKKTHCYFASNAVTPNWSTGVTEMEHLIVGQEEHLCTLTNLENSISVESHTQLT